MLGDVSSVGSLRPSTAPSALYASSSGGTVAMLPAAPADPWKAKRLRWLEQQQERATAALRYTAGAGSRATKRAASLDALSPVALLGGGSPRPSPFSRLEAATAPRPKSAGAPSMMVENPGTKLKNELKARGRKVQRERKERFERIMAEKAAIYAEQMEAAAVLREKEAKVRVKVRKSKLAKVSHQPPAAC